MIFYIQKVKGQLEADFIMLCSVSQTDSVTVDGSRGGGGGYEYNDYPVSVVFFSFKQFSSA